MEQKNLSVIGAGTMGHGIAQIAAGAGYTTKLFDLSQDVLEKSLTSIKANLKKGLEKGKISTEYKAKTLANLSLITKLPEAVQDSDLIIEAIPEKKELKKELFQQLENLTSPSCIYASNTSSISITQLAQGLKNPEQFIGMHFFNPVHIMSLLEIVVHEGTSPATLEKAQSFGEIIGKTPIVVKDFPGFASSRLGLALGLEAIRMLEQGVASAQDIDTAMELGYRHPMGPLKLTDLVGLDVRLKIADYLFTELQSESFRAPELLRSMVAEGKLGKKSGQGFYQW